MNDSRKRSSKRQRETNKQTQTKTTAPQITVQHHGVSRSFGSVGRPWVPRHESDVVLPEASVQVRRPIKKGIRLSRDVQLHCQVFVKIVKTRNGSLDTVDGWRREVMNNHFWFEDNFENLIWTVEVNWLENRVKIVLYKNRVSGTSKRIKFITPSLSYFKNSRKTHGPQCQDQRKYIQWLKLMELGPFIHLFSQGEITSISSNYF